MTCEKIEYRKAKEGENEKEIFIKFEDSAK